MLALIAFAAVALAPRPVAVMVHGAGGGGWEYRSWKPAFERGGYRVVALDLQPAKGGLIATTFQDYVNQVVLASGARPRVLIGASLGGMIVLKAAERLKPEALVLVCSTTPAGIGKRDPAPRYPAVIKWKGGPYSDTVASMPDSDEATRRFAHPRWRDESGAVLNEIALGIQVAKPRCPVLCIIPESDDTVPPETQQALALWAGADSVRYRGMSHVGPLLSTRAAEVAGAALHWLEMRR